MFFYEVYLSKIQGKGIFDPSGSFVGKVKDVLVAIVPDEVFPKVTWLSITRDREPFALPIEAVDVFNQTILTTNLQKTDLPWQSLPTEAVHLKRDIIDRQVVDTHGSKVVRVNDLKLAKINQEIRLIAADVGPRGFLRRLGLEPLANLIAWLTRREPLESLISWNFIEPLQTNLQAVKLTVSQDKLDALHPADIAHIISQVHPQEQKAIIASLEDEQVADTLPELEPHVQINLLESLKAFRATRILEKMPPDEAADVLGDLSEEQAQALLTRMGKKAAAEIRKLLQHRDRTAGGLMTTEYIAFPRELSVRETIERLRALAPEAETISYLYVVDQTNHLVGVLTLRNLIIAKPDDKLETIMIDKVIAVPPDMEELSVAEMISKYNLLAIPVVEPDDTLLGIVTVDDILDILLPPLAKKKRKLLG